MQSVVVVWAIVMASMRWHESRSFLVRFAIYDFSRDQPWNLSCDLSGSMSMRSHGCRSRWPVRSLACDKSGMSFLSIHTYTYMAQDHCVYCYLSFLTNGCVFTARMIAISLWGVSSTHISFLFTFIVQLLHCIYLWCFRWSVAVNAIQQGLYMCCFPSTGARFNTLQGLSRLQTRTGWGFRF